MIKRVLAGVGLLLVVGGTAARAQEGRPPPPGADGPPPQDRMMTRADAIAMAERRFAMLDRDHDGMVTRVEMDAARNAMQLHRGRHGEPGRDPGMPPQPPPGADGAPPPPPPGEEAHRPMMRGMALAMGRGWFDRADADHDGRVTLEEARAAASAEFDRLDTDRDGMISWAERRAGMRAMMRKPGWGG